MEQELSLVSATILVTNQLRKKLADCGGRGRVAKEADELRFRWIRSTLGGRNNTSLYIFSSDSKMTGEP
jgi:hypothetical protein